MNRLVRRSGSSADARANSGRLITERQTRDTKKTTNAAAVHGTPSRHPNASTVAAPIANSVSQNDLTRQSSAGSRSHQSQSGTLLLARGRARRRAFQVAADELLE